ncbi:hypothetical protein HY449_03540 [Candidatus Pacearchaeota archaeon]|nr:hypothetical protein [Candidatus Pacearchaeota archaeon]
MKTWGDLESVDEIFSDAERELIGNLEKEAPERKRCPSLKKEGKFFYYCGLQAGDEAELELNPTNPVIRSRQSQNELQIWCMDEKNYQRCIFYIQKGKAR